MAIYAKVTRIMTTDFAEISILDGQDVNEHARRGEVSSQGKDQRR